MNKYTYNTAATHRLTGIVSNIRRKARLMALPFIVCSLLLGTTACSEDEGTVYNEFENWQFRNDVFFATLEDSLAQAPAEWLKLKNYSLNPDIAGVNTEYVYAKVLSAGQGSETPQFTDSVRVSYQGRLIPSASYPSGLVFDTTVYGDYDATTNATVKFAVSGLVDGFTTALIHMPLKATWRIYIPYTLGYGATATGSIPAFSTLCFDVTLVGIGKPGHVMPTYSSRRR